MKLEEKIINLVSNKIKETGVSLFLEELNNYFDSSSQMYLVGGVLRDAARSILEDIEYKIKDVDVLVVKGDLEKAISFLKLDFTRTFFGGFRLNFNHKMQVDIWKIEKTIRTIPDENLTPLENYLNDLYLNIDHIAFNFKDKILIDKGCTQAIKEKVIELKFTNKEYEPQPVDLSRAISLLRRTSYKAGDKLKKVIVNNKEIVINNILKKAETNKYYEEKKQELISIVEELC